MNNNQISTPVLIAIIVVALIVIIGGGALYLNHKGQSNLGSTVTGSGNGSATPEGVATFQKAYPGLAYPGSGGSTGTSYPAGYPGTGGGYPAGYPGTTGSSPSGTSGQ